MTSGKRTNVVMNAADMAMIIAGTTMGSWYVIAQIVRSIRKGMTMRPIDADELIKELTLLKHDKEYSDVDEGYDYGIDDCIDEIKNAPTIDVVPTIHAYWKESGRIYEDYDYHLDFFDCSACGWKNPYADTSWFKFCPNCGAKMDD